MTWTDDRVTTLTQLWGDGHSASVIAARVEKSRNAVIGKAHRLHLARRATPHAAALCHPRASRPNVIAFRPTRSLPPKIPVKQPETKRATQIPALAPAPAHPPGLGELKTGECPWPEGDPKRPGFHYCGRPATNGYCPHHHAIGTQPAKPRKQKAPPAAGHITPSNPRRLSCNG
jgi:GcrA cell cycle regulator